MCNMVVMETSNKMKGKRRCSAESHLSFEEPASKKRAVGVYLPSLYPNSQNKINSNLKHNRGRWTKDENKALIFFAAELIDEEGKIDFKAISEKIPTRTAKQCKERYENSLNPDMKRGEWSIEETISLAGLISEYGQNWTAIKKDFKSRSYNGVKKRGMKILGEILDRKCIPPGFRGKIRSDWSKREVEIMLQLHQEHKYNLAEISYQLRTSRSEADIDRRLLQNCPCEDCTTRFEALDLEGTRSFREAWSKSKAEDVKEKLLKQKAAGITIMTRHSSVESFSSEESEPADHTVAIDNSWDSSACTSRDETEVDDETLEAFVDFLKNCV